MIGLVLVTHGNLANEFVSAMQHVVGQQQNVATVCIGPEDDMEVRRAEILQKVENVNSGKGVVVLTDMFGGTPSNLAISIRVLCLSINSFIFICIPQNPCLVFYKKPFFTQKV